MHPDLFAPHLFKASHGAMRPRSLGLISHSKLPAVNFSTAKPIDLITKLLICWAFMTLEWQCSSSCPWDAHELWRSRYRILQYLASHICSFKWKQIHQIIFTELFLYIYSDPTHRQIASMVSLYDANGTKHYRKTAADQEGNLLNRVKVGFFFFFFLFKTGVSPVQSLWLHEKR